MKRSWFTAYAVVSLFILTMYACSDAKKEEAPAATVKSDFGGYATKEEWGQHLVTITGCNDCHTPKKMTPMGPADDSSLYLSGHPEKMPPPDFERKQIESKGLVLTATFTAWVGPWGISYAANLTPDETGTGNWTEDQFIYALRGKTSKGLPGSRPLLPPMSMMPFDHMTDAELKAVYAYLRTVKPIKNLSVQPTPPVIRPKS